MKSIAYHEYGSPDVLHCEELATPVPGDDLAIFASPHNLGPMLASLTPEQRSAAEAIDADTTGAQVSAFQKGNPHAKVVILAHANHFIFASNEAEVLREINSFAAMLK
jgi:non-heme chloroperoxidase